MATSAGVRAQNCRPISKFGTTMTLQAWQLVWQSVIALGIILGGVGSFGAWVISQRISDADAMNDKTQLESRTSDDASFKAEIGKFILVGNQLRPGLFGSAWNSHELDVESWEQNILAYLSKTRPYLVPYFQSEVNPSPLAYANTSPAQTRAIKRLDQKIKRLEDVLIQ